MMNPQMYSNTSGLSNPQDECYGYTVDEGFEEIFFYLLIQGNKQLVRKYVRNYLNNFCKKSKGVI